MRIAIREIESLAKAIFKWNDEGTLADDKCDDFIEWGSGMLKSLGGPVWEDHGIDLPPQFIHLYRQLQKSPGYKLDADSLMHQAEQERTSSPYIVRAPTPITNMNTGSTFLQRFDQLTRGTKSAFGGIETARRDGSDSELGLSVRTAFAALGAERRMSCDPVAKLLRDPERRATWEAIGRKFMGGRLTTDDSALLEKALTGGGRKAFTPGISPSSDLGSALFLAASVSDDVLYASWQYGAYKDLGLRVLTGALMKYCNITQPAQGFFITPNNQGKVVIPSDVFLSGDEVCELANTIACLVEASVELIQDGKTAIAEAILRGLAEGHAKAVDYASLQGNGNDDPLNGVQTGIFADPNIASAPSANGNTSVSALQRDDFINVIAAVDPSALVRSPRWFISAAFLPKLLRIRDGVGPQYVLRTPAETKGDWELVGFPVTWSTQAPGNDAIGQKVAAFGAPDGYLVALQENIEVMASDAARFTANIRQLRLLNRGIVMTRQANWLATLQLAKQ
jgi:hypothetical protein